MPGPVSDSYNPEWGTEANREEIEEALQDLHAALGVVIGSPPKHVLEVVRMEPGDNRTIRFDVRQLRLLRFACERAGEAL